MTSTIQHATETRNWDVFVLLNQILMGKGLRHHSRQFHQMFRQLPPTEHGKLRDCVLEIDVGHFDHLLGENR